MSHTNKNSVNINEFDNRLLSEWKERAKKAPFPGTDRRWGD